MFCYQGGGAHEEWGTRPGSRRGRLCLTFGLAQEQRKKQNCLGRVEPQQPPGRKLEQGSEGGRAGPRASAPTPPPLKGSQRLGGALKLIGEVHVT